MRSLLPLAFCALTLLVGFNAEQSARATINEHQEQQAEALCQADPSLCGNTSR
jgi:hypothetical protein